MISCKVVRINMTERQIVDFAGNKRTGPASKLLHMGFARPSHCAFGPDGTLYVVDFGEIDIAPKRAASGCVRIAAACGAFAARAALAVGALVFGGRLLSRLVGRRGPAWAKRIWRELAEGIEWR